MLQLQAQEEHFAFASDFLGDICIGHPAGRSVFLTVSRCSFPFSYTCLFISHVLYQVSSCEILNLICCFQQLLFTVCSIGGSVVCFLPLPLPLGFCVARAFCIFYCVFAVFLVYAHEKLLKFVLWSSCMLKWRLEKRAKPPR